MTTQQESLWQGLFGNLYQERNKFTQEEVNKRIPLFENIIKTIYMNCNDFPKSYLEIGAGQGQNLAALENISMKTQTAFKLYATEVNSYAKEQIKENVKNAEILEEIPKTPIVDMAFTYGVLIHTHPAHLRSLQEKIFIASRRWIVCTEYFAPEMRPLVYRGEKDALWLDDYGSRWIDNFPLRILGYGFAWKKTTGLDNVMTWMFEKTEKMN